MKSKLLKILSTLTLMVVVILAGCVVGGGYLPAEKMNLLSIGMTKAEVISAMGRPSSTAAPSGGVEILRYNLSPSATGHFLTGSYDEYFVRLADGKVESYGKMGDFDSTKDPTLDVTIKNR